MSGGSFDYLYRKEAEELLHDLETAQAMADALAEVGARDAANATREYIGKLKLIRDAFLAADDKTLPLRRLWYAMEWWRSNDIGEDGFQKELAIYREQAANA